MRSNNSKTIFTLRSIPLHLLAAVLLIAGWASSSQALPAQTMAPIIGEIEAITITTPGNVWSGGTMTVGGQIIIIPANLLINLPNDYQSLQQLYTNAPAACKTSGLGGTAETGLAKTDKCNSRATGAQANILANRTDSGNVIAGQVDIFKAVENVTGNVTYVDIAGGYFRVNGILNSATTGVMVRANDPTSRHTVQTGLGCAAGTAAVNCSPDVRFKIDPDNYTFCYITGYPACIPTAANDPNCPTTNRPPIAPIISSNPFAAPPLAADSRHFAPITVGDPVVIQGNFETVAGVTFLSASSIRINVDLTTNGADPTQPNYLIINEDGWDGPAYPAGRVRGRLLTNSSVHDSEIDFFSIHYDPVNNAPHEQILYTTRFNKQFGVVVFNVPTGVSDSQIRYDFFPGAAGAPGGKTIAGQEPCASLWGTEPKAGGSPVADLAAIGISVPTFCPNSTGLGIVDNFNLMAPIFREVMARSTRSEIPVGAVGHVTGVALDIHGRPAQSGFYKLPTAIAYGAFEDINLGMGQFPFQFSGNPFLLDRRLSPNGCVGPCEATQQPLTPFPFEGIDPRLVAPTFGFCVAGSGCTTLPNPNRMLTFMTAAGSMTGLLSWPPANAPALPIVATPGLNMFPPFADEDDATTVKGVPVIINVVANDIASFGTIDPASVKIPTFAAPGILGTLPSGAIVQVNPNGTITYTPAPTFSGADTFTYTVANNFGSVSLPGTVNVAVQVGPTAVADSAIVPAGSTRTLTLVGNDIAGTSPINLSSVVIVSPLPVSGICGTLTNNLDGDVSYTAPSIVPVPATCTFTYTIRDFSVPVALLSNAATVTLTIAPPVVPVALNDTATTTTGSAVIIPVLANDNAGTSTLNLASVAVNAPTGAIAPNTLSGTAAANPDGTVTYTAPATAGTYTFTYTVKNTATTPSISNVATVTVTVTQGHIAPVAVNDTAITPAGSLVVINVIGNDTATAPSIINPASLTVNTPTGGTAAANLDGTINYTAPTVAGTYTFTYTVKDNFATPVTSNIATVTITVLPVSTMTTPVNASALTGASQTFTWANTGASLYSLWVGRSLGNSDIFATSGGTTATTVNVTGLPTNGSTVFVRLWTLVNNTWVFNDYTYTAASLNLLATMTSPVNASILVGANQTFTWSNTGASLYSLWVGTTLGNSNIFATSGGTAATTVNATGFPSNGSTVFVRLWTLVNGSWLFNDYTYTSN